MEINMKNSETSKRIIDYISGRDILGTLEEVEVIQPISVCLVEENGYPKEHIRTRPQFQIPKSPSDESETYPLDIVVFENENHNKNNIRMIIECKSPDLSKGRSQLEKYMGLCSAKIGVWFNGKDTVVIKKI